MMFQTILVLIPICLLAFWAWMFTDMMKSDYLSPCFVTFTNGRDSKFDWGVMFIFLNIVAAVFYYINIYRERQFEEKVTKIKKTDGFYPSVKTFCSGKEWPRTFLSFGERLLQNLSKRFEHLRHTNPSGDVNFRWAIDNDLLSYILIIQPV